MKSRKKAPRVLLIGGAGQVGYDLWQALASQTDLLVTTSPWNALSSTGLPLIKLDIRDDIAVSRLISDFAPEIIINAAAYTAVDRAEIETEVNWAVNAHAPLVIAQNAAKVGASVLAFSSDYVYSGEGDAPYLESEAPAPVSAYGKAKLAGDQAIVSSGVPHIILRTSWIFGLYGQNFVKTMLRLGLEKQEIRVVSDQIGSPTAARSLADFVVHLLAQYRFQNDAIFEEKSGIYHFCDKGYVSWHEYATYIFACAREKGHLLKVDQVTPILSSEFPSAARRPKNSRLCLSKLEEVFQWKPQPWRDTVMSVTIPLLKL